MTIEDVDLVHLRRCVELSGEARARGDQPFARGDAHIAVVGPVAEVEAEARAAVAGYWV